MLKTLLRWPYSTEDPVHHESNALAIMYQSQFSRPSSRPIVEPTKSIDDVIDVHGVRPAIWEEHCLECSAPDCFTSCSLYEPRSDGRCQRFENSIELIQSFEQQEERARISFKRWGNLLSGIYPGYVSIGALSGRMAPLPFRVLRRALSIVASPKLPTAIVWPVTRVLEYVRRLMLRGFSLKSDCSERSDAFVLHLRSHHVETFRLILEAYENDEPVYKTSFQIEHGENLKILRRDQYSDACDRVGNYVKIFPENNIEAELEVFFCSFVRGKVVDANQPPDSQVKCLVWDLDRTLWDGILTETEPDTLQLREGVHGTMLELDRRGILQSIASKNDADPAIAHLSRLGIKDYFLVPQIHWGRKSDSMIEIANRLNIGVESLALIDDSEFEREEVTSRIPQIRTFTENEVSSLLRNSAFKVRITAQSANRRQSYITESTREEFRSQNDLELGDFIRMCEVTIRITEPVSSELRQRCYELLQRTNQLNISGRKHSWESFEALLQDSEAVCIAFSCSDKFGEYGVVGFSSFTIRKGQLEFAEFALSCRVARKHVENAFLNYVKNTYEAKQYIFPVKKTPRNNLIRQTLSEMELLIVDDNDEWIVFDFSENINNADDVKVLSDSTKLESSML